MSSARGNFDGSYPPIFYATMGVFASKDVALSTIAMRLFNALLFVGVVTTLALLISREERGPLLWGSIIAVVPLGMFIIPSVNPSSWAVLSAATLWISLVGFFRAEAKTARVALGSLATLLAVIGAGARGDSAAYVALAAVIAMILTFERTWQWLRLAVLPLAHIVIGGIFFFASGHSTGVAGISDGVAPAELTLGSILRGIYTNLTEIQSLWIGNLGYWGLGWLDTAMPPIVWVTIVTLFGALAFWGLREMYPRKAIALALVALALIAVPMYVLVREQLVVGQGVQPRYVLPLMFLLAGLAIYGFEREDLDLTRSQTLIICIGMALANSVALFANLRRYVTGIDRGGLNLNAGIEWWWSTPISPMVVWLGGSTAFAVLLLCLFFMIQGGSRHLPASTSNSALDQR